MSNQEVHCGTLIPIEFIDKIDHLTDLEQVKFLESLGYIIDYEEEEGKLLYIDPKSDLYKVKDKWYKIKDTNKINEYDLFSATRLDEGSIDYILSYYNGRYCFDEALKKALKDIK